MAQADHDGALRRRLTAQWWKWALETPTPTNPVLDPTGEHCAANQPRGGWFLAGSFGEPAERSCTIPYGRPIFAPMVNTFYGAFLDDAPETKTLPYLREQVACEWGEPVATLNGRSVNRFVAYSQSGRFAVRLPEDNVFGVTEEIARDLVLYPSIAAGMHLLLPPLPPGEHELHWTASSQCGEASFNQDVTYHLTVERRHRR